MVIVVINNVIADALQNVLLVETGVQDFVD